LIGAPTNILTVLLTVASVSIVGGCTDGSEQRDFVARVGTEYLYEADVQRVLADLPAEQDRAAARESYVEQWVTAALLAEDARAKSIDREPTVEALVTDNERSILAAAVVKRMYEEEVPQPTSEQILRYFDTVRESTEIREPYVRVRYLRSGSADSAAAARRLLQRAMRGSDADSLWNIIARRYASDPTTSSALASTFVPEATLFRELPEVDAALNVLADGQIATIIEDDSAWHVLQLVGRAQPGTQPEASWIRDELVRRVQLQQRREAYARKVQSLRNAAERRNDIEFGARSAGGRSQ